MRILINKSGQVVEVMRTYQGLILDVLEQSFGEHRNWQAARARVLKLLGDNGLTRRVQEIVTSCVSEGGAQ